MVFVLYIFEFFALMAKVSGHAFFNLVGSAIIENIT